MNCRRGIPVRRHTRFVVIRWLNVDDGVIVPGHLDKPLDAMAPGNELEYMRYFL